MLRVSPVSQLVRIVRRHTVVHRVLVIETGTLLDDGVESLLGQETDLQVSGISYADGATFLEDVSQARPDVILLNENGPLDSARIFELLNGLPGLASLRLIIVRPDDNTIDMYEKKQVVATHIDDLLHLIRGNRST